MYFPYAPYATCMATPLLELQFGSVVVSAVFTCIGALSTPQPR